MHQATDAVMRFYAEDGVHTPILSAFDVGSTSASDTLDAELVTRESNAGLSYGVPKLDEHFQTNIPGLFITSMAATQDFGPFFGFTYAVGTSAKSIGRAIAGRHSNLT